MRTCGSASCENDGPVADQRTTRERGFWDEHPARVHPGFALLAA